MNLFILIIAFEIQNKTNKVYTYFQGANETNWYMCFSIFVISFCCKTYEFNEDYLKKAKVIAKKYVIGALCSSLGYSIYGFDKKDTNKIRNRS